MEIPWNRNLTDQICTNHPPPLASYHCLFVCKSRKISYAVVGVVMCHVLCFSACVMFLLDNYILTRYIVFSSFKLWHHTLNFVRSCGGICWILCNEFRAMTPKCYLCYMPGCVYVCMSAWCSIHLLPELFLAPMCTVQEAWGKESEVFVLCHPCLGHQKKNEQELQKCEIENLSKWHAAGGSPQERQALQNCLHWAHDQTNAKSKNFTQSTNVSSICLLNDSLKILLFAAISNQNVESKAGVSLGVNARSTWWPAQLPRSAVAYVVDTLIGKNLRSKILKTATLFMIAPKIAQCYMFVLPQKRIIRCTNLSPQHGTVYTLPCHSLLYLTNVSLHHSNDMPNCKN